MNGLLDDNSQAQLMLAAGLLGGGNFGQALQRGLLGYGQSMAASEARKTSSEDRLMRRQLQEAQMEETRAQAQQRMAQIEEIKRKQAQELANRQLLQSGMTPQQMLANGVPAELVKNFAESQNWGRAKVGGMIETVDEQGRPVSRMRDEYGNIIGGDLRQWKAPQVLNTGGAQTVFDPAARQVIGNIANTVSPDAALSASTARRGQDMTDARARMESAQRDKVEYKQDANGNWFAFPKDVAPGQAITPTRVDVPGKREQQATSALNIIADAKGLINKGTGSYIGAGLDAVGRTVGASTAGGNAIAQLKALEGALMMAQPRMEGPQSDKDVALYRQMAGQLGDPTVPRSQKLAAITTIEALHRKYTQSQPVEQQIQPSGGFRILGVER